MPRVLLWWSTLSNFIRWRWFFWIPLWTLLFTAGRWNTFDELSWTSCETSSAGTMTQQFQHTTNVQYPAYPRWGELPYKGYIGMCGPKGYGFSAVLVINRVSILTRVSILVLNRLRLLYSGLKLGMFFRKSYFFIIIDKTDNRSPSKLMLRVTVSASRNGHK